VRIVKKRTLEDYWSAHADATKPLQAWYQTAAAADWKTLSDVRATFPHADLVGRLTVFNIKGNSYRLVVRIEYKFHLIFVRWFGTHDDYDSGNWQQDDWF